jgi:hypothetical protein
MTGQDDDSPNVTQPSTDRERFAGADGVPGSFAWLPETPTETVAFEVEDDDMDFVEAISTDWDD